MFGLGKKKQAEQAPEELPRLPELPQANDNLVLPSSADLPDVPAGLPDIETEEAPALPELPNLQPEQTIPEIKQELDQPPETINQPPETEPIADIQPPENPDMQPSTFPTPDLPDIPKITKPEIGTKIGHAKSLGFSRPSTKRSKPIYIRLDKFETTVESFGEIQNKVREIEGLLKEIKNIKLKEEQELNEWEREIQIIKSRLEFIDKNIFNKLD